MAEVQETDVNAYVVDVQEAEAALVQAEGNLAAAKQRLAEKRGDVEEVSEDQETVEVKKSKKGKK